MSGMRVLFGLLTILFSLEAVLAVEIREFSLETLERLGNELSHRDDIAARAADLVVERHPEWKKVTPQWWITDLHKDVDVVYLIDSRKSQAVLGYKVIFPKGGSASVLDARGQPLPPQVAIRYKALQTALKVCSPD